MYTYRRHIHDVALKVQVNRFDENLFATYQKLWKDGQFLSKYKSFEFPWKAKALNQKPTFEKMLFPSVDKAKVNHFNEIKYIDIRFVTFYFMPESI